MTVRSQLPWPLRWVAIALVFGFSASVSMWAFEFGQTIAGVDGIDRGELARLRVEVDYLRGERERMRSLVAGADSLMKAEQAAQEQLARQVRQIEAENLSLKADLAFFERLLPAIGNGMNVRGLHAELEAPGQLRFQMLVMQPGRGRSFSGNYELQLSGTLDGQPWTYTLPEGPRPLEFRQYGRIEGLLGHPPQAVVESVQVKVMDASGDVRAMQTVKL